MNHSDTKTRRPNRPVADFVLSCGITTFKPFKGHEMDPLLSIPFMPSLVSRMPKQNSERALTDSILMFMLPEGGVLRTFKAPSFFHSFALTLVDGSLLYGHVLTRFFRLSSNRTELVRKLMIERQQKASQEFINEKRKNSETSSDIPMWEVLLREEEQKTIEEFQLAGTLYAPMCLCVVTSQPYHFSLLRFLHVLSQELPIKTRFRDNVVKEVYSLVASTLVPKIGMETQIRMKEENVTFYSPPKDSLPLADLDYKYLFRALNAKNVVRVITALLNERHVILLGEYGIISHVAEVLISLLYPFSWQFVYIPVLPPSLKDFFAAPMPFFIGVSVEAFEKILAIGDVDLPMDSVIVNLLEDKVDVFGDPLVHLPAILANNLVKSINIHAASVAKSEQDNDSSGEKRDSNNRKNTLDRMNNWVRSRSASKGENKVSRDTSLIPPMSIGNDWVNGPVFTSSFDSDSDTEIINNTNRDIRASSEASFKTSDSEPEKKSIRASISSQSSISKLKIMVKGEKPVALDRTYLSHEDSLELRKAFFKVFTILFKYYRPFLKIDKESISNEEFFDTEAFLEHMTLEKKNEFIPFYNNFLKSQMFISFIQDRITTREKDIFEIVIENKMKRKAVSVTVLDKMSKTGYLKKQGHKFKTWKKRYFVLSEGLDLSYYAIPKPPKDGEPAMSPTDESLLRGTLRLEPGNTTVLIPQDSRFSRFEFQLICGIYVLKMRAESNEQRKEWVNAFKAKTMDDVQRFNVVSRSLMFDNELIDKIRKVKEEKTIHKVKNMKEIILPVTENLFDDHSGTIDARFLSVRKRKSIVKSRFSLSMSNVPPPPNKSFKPTNKNKESSSTDDESDIDDIN